MVVLASRTGCGTGHPQLCTESLSDLLEQQRWHRLTQCGCRLPVAFVRDLTNSLRHTGHHLAPLSQEMCFFFSAPSVTWPWAQINFPLSESRVTSLPFFSLPVLLSRFITFLSLKFASYFSVSCPLTLAHCVAMATWCVTLALQMRVCVLTAPLRLQHSFLVRWKDTQ